MTETMDVMQFQPIKKIIAANGDLKTAQREGGDSSFGTLVESFLKYVSQNGIPEGFNWSDVKAVIVSKFEEVAKAFEAETPISSLPAVPNVDNYTFDEYHQRILGYLDRFEDAPFTIGRICELLVEPRKHYDRGDKFLRAFEKCVSVTSTNGQFETSSITNGNHLNGNDVNGNDGDNHTVTNGTASGNEKMDTETHNGHTNGTTEKTTATTTPSVTTSAEGSTTTDTGLNKTETTEDKTPTTAETTTENSNTTTLSEGEKQGTPQKRQLEDSDSSHETVAKKVARMENGGLNGELGEPEVEPTINGKDVHAEKTGVEVDNTTTETVGEKKDAKDQEVTGEVAAV
ncbi:hypothetical protein RvY_17823 [Ramazzottius varieornatus]|uniref:Serine/threonine-protein phosphatase 4 regulatory subunit 2 n=1 Tax=Ramazzottius varieornatus TaxID=947166 RepID=A0A1D1W3I9_RAMVA|nr:hypothetical protein RvY_17823 [Ramazzottius varieornatus]